MTPQEQLALFRSPKVKTLLKKAIDDEEILYAKAEVKLVKLRDVALLEAYVAKTPLSYEAVVALIKLGDPAMIKASLSSNFTFTKEQQILLINSGKTEAILEYCGECSFCNEAEKLLLEQASEDVIEYYYERWGLSSEALHMAFAKNLI